MGAFRDFGLWPKLLAGPMVRRVTPHEAHFFVATKVECTVEVTVYEGGGVTVPITDPAVALSGPTPLRRLGEWLWIGLVPVDVSGLSSGQEVSYNIELIEPDGQRSDLYRLGLLGRNSSPLAVDDLDDRRMEVPLGYEPGVLPMFVIPPGRVEDLYLVHASCRKPHGGEETEPDAMQLVDAAIAASRLGNGQRRPQQLILTGDQIYADDVSAALLVACREAGKVLLGWDEQLPMTEDPVIDFLVAPGWRTRYLAMSGVDIKAIASKEELDYSANHLLRFAEWVAMYLFAWSDALWAINAEEYDLPEPGALVPDGSKLAAMANLIPTDRPMADILNVAADVNEALTAHQRKVNEAWEDTRKKALGYARSCRNTRRVLANVATYTMFDDHEVTDDWYLSRRVHDELKGRLGSAPSSEVGPRLLRNGLSAYAFFQHWGNVPEDFADGARGAELLDLWTYSGATPPPIRQQSKARHADDLLDIGASDAQIPRQPSGRVEDRDSFTRIRWDYAVGFPCHRLVALDTRTWRHFPSDPGVTWAELANALPEPAGSFATNGLAELEAVTAEWIPVATAAGNEAVQRLGELIDRVVQLAQAMPHGDAAVGTTVGENPPAPPPAPAAFVAACGEAVRAAYAFVEVCHDSLEDAAVEADEWLEANEVWYEASAANTIAALNGSPVDFGTGFVVALVSSAADAGWGVAGSIPELLRGLASLLQAVSFQSTRAMLLATGEILASVTDSVWSTLLRSPSTVPGSLANHVDHAGQAIAQRLAALPTDDLNAALLRNGNNRLGVGLIRQDALEFQVSDPLASVAADVPVTVMLSPAPIFGNRMVELAQRVQLIKLLANGQAGEEAVDFEPWTGNAPALRWFLEAAAAAPNIVVVSGDVHYAGSSVNRIDSGPALTTNYVQLTSSASRNSDAMTRGLALLDDLLYTDSGEVFFIQSDFTSILQGGSSSLAHLGHLALASVERSLMNLYEHHSPSELARRFSEWLNEPFPGLDGILEVLGELADAPANTLRTISREASWRIFQASQILQEFADDPLGAVLGDFLTAGPLMRQQLQRLFVEIGLDPTMALRFGCTVLVDRRTDRIDRYPVKDRLAATSLAERTSLEAAQRRTVGRANAGFISFTTDQGRPTGLKHELRWYPHDIPPAGPPNPLRTDWYGTLHEAGWQNRPATRGAFRPVEGLRPPASATCWNPTVRDVVSSAVQVATDELADWVANPTWEETTTDGGRRVQDYWLLFTSNTEAKMVLDEHEDTEHWSAAFISWCFARAYLQLAPEQATAADLDPEDFDGASAADRHRMLRQARTCLGDLGYFSVSASHYGYFTNSIALDNTNAVLLSPSDAVIRPGDLVYAGRGGHSYEVRDGRLVRTAGANFFSHADLVIELGSDANGDFAVVVGGNIGDRVATKNRRLTADGRLRSTEGQEAVMRLSPEEP